MVPSTTFPVPLNVIDPPTLTVAKNDRVASTVVPGTSSASDKYWRELSGSVSICSRVTVPEISAFVTSTIGDSPRIVTLSASACTFIVRSWRNSRPIVMTISATSWMPKPESSARSV